MRTLPFFALCSLHFNSGQNLHPVFTQWVEKYA
jgi:hypothetical protein